MKPMSLAKAVEFYLKCRRQLGFRMREDGQMLRQLVKHASQQRHRGPLTNALALAWAQAPSNASRLWWARRLDAVRRFASFWRTIDLRTEVPPKGVFGPSYRRRAVHLYSTQQIAALMRAAGKLRGLRGLTFQTLFGLLACTGLRIGEALRLREEDIDWNTAVLTIRCSKLGRSRHVPLHPSTLKALQGYRRRRQKYCRQTVGARFFLGQNGRAVSYSQAAQTFRFLRQALGWKQHPTPRLHDLRHTFAVGRLIDWHQKGGDIGQKTLWLSTYLGHTRIENTYWYLSAVPELLALTHARWSELTLKTKGAHV